MKSVPDKEEYNIYTYQCRMWGYILLGLLVVFMFWSIFKGSSQDLKSRGPFNLKQQPKVAESSSSQLMLADTNTGTLRFFIYPLAFQRTGKLVSCNTDTIPNPGEPECSSGRYTMCMCNGNDCSKCRHDGYVNIINISNIIRLELLTAPDASRQNAASVQLVVRTYNGPLQKVPGQGRCPNGMYEYGTDKGGFCCPVKPSNDGQNCPQGRVCAIDPTQTQGNPVCQSDSSASGKKIMEETLVLPHLPIQKWTMVTIAREGRRFDIYYNDSLALSKRTQNMVDVQSAFGPVIAGDPLLEGKVATVKVYSNKLSATDVSREYSTLADTNGQPYLESNQVNLMDYMPICKGGSCLQGPKVRPSSPLMDWETDYA